MRYLILLVPFLLAACADASAVAPQSGNAAYALEIAKGRATASAIETDAAWSANAALTADARTVVASNRNATLAAQAQQNAMLYAQATSTAQAQYSSATSTALYNIARAAETMQAGQAQASATAAARASDATATSDAHKWQTTATAERRTLEAEIARVQATATAQTVALQIQQTQADAAANAERAQFVQSLINFVIVMVGLAAMCAICLVLVAGAMAFVRWMNGRAAKQYVIETRAGTILIQRGADGNYFADIVQRTLSDDMPAFPVRDVPTALPKVVAEPETLKVTNLRGTQLITKDAPEDERAAADRKLALDLLRESLQYYGRKQSGINPMVVNRIPTWHTLGWGAASWQRAIELLRPYVQTREGRGGGTYCIAPYPTVYQLYEAIGERRVALATLASEAAA